MHSKFEMSMMGELKFFLGIQIHQSPRGIFINQVKYAQEILKKHGLHFNVLLKSEYVSLSACSRSSSMLVLRLLSMAVHFDKIPMYCDSKGSIAICAIQSRIPYTKHNSFLISLHKGTCCKGFKYHRQNSVSFGKKGKLTHRIMSITKEQQQALDDALVPAEQRLRIRNSLLISASVPAIYMHEFWATKFKDPPFEEEILAFIRELGYLGYIKSQFDVKVDTIYQPWRTFGTIINKCLSDLVYQIENKVSKKNKDMFYSRFTKVIIKHFMSKDQSTLRRNKVDWHMAKDDLILTTMRFIPKHETVQKYGSILPDTLTNQTMKESEAYKTYYDFATGKVILKPKYVRQSTREKTDQSPKDSLGKRLKATTKVAKSRKKKLHAQGLETLSKIAFKHDDDDNADNEDDDDQDDDTKQTESDNDGDDFVHPKFSTYDEEERQDEEDKDEEWSDDEVTQGGNVEKEKMDEEKT
ncbi:hypothetical protein Tco_0805679, partial [Tanacetum coccineum]